MKSTLLDMTQNILSAMSSDEVNSISDTTESLQVAEILKTCFFNILSRSELTSDETPFQLDDSGDITKPVLMYKPENVDKLEWIKYYDNADDANTFKYVTVLPNIQFLDKVNSYDITSENVDTFVFQIEGDTFNLNYKVDVTPTYCTAFKNYYIVFDSYDASVDSTLQASKTMCFGKTSPVWRMEDSFIPDIDEKLFPLLLNEAKSLAFLELKQLTHAKAEQESRRQWNTLQKNKSLTDKPTSFDQLPNFGRTRSGTRSASRW